jgi:hypothetical protein
VKKIKRKKEKKKEEEGTKKKKEEEETNLRLGYKFLRVPAKFIRSLCYPTWAVGISSSPCSS